MRWPFTLRRRTDDLQSQLKRVRENLLKLRERIGPVDLFAGAAYDGKVNAEMARTARIVCDAGLEQAAKVVLNDLTQRVEASPDEWDNEMRMHLLYLVAVRQLRQQVAYWAEEKVD